MKKRGKLKKKKATKFGKRIRIEFFFFSFNKLKTTFVLLLFFFIFLVKKKKKKVINRKPVNQQLIYDKICLD